MAHVWEMRDQPDEGKLFLEDKLPDWENGILLSVHLWWHYCLFVMGAQKLPDGQDRFEIVRNIYQSKIHKTEGLLNMADSSSLLWRLKLKGEVMEKKFWQEMFEHVPELITTSHSSLLFLSVLMH
jgi:hypothetical protein